MERENVSVFKERERYERVRLHNMTQLESGVVFVFCFLFFFKDLGASSMRKSSG